MYETVINLSKIDLELADQLYSHLLFEYKDFVTLSMVREIVQGQISGNYNIVKWADTDNSQIDEAFEVVIRFGNREEFVEWMLKWG